MKRFLVVAGLALALVFPAYAVPAARSSGSHSSSSSTTKPKVYVKGYYRKDGTYVAPHWRAASGTSQSTSSPKPPSTSTPRTPSASSSTTAHPKGCQTCPRDANGRILRDPAARAQFLRQTGYPHGRPGYVVDHIVPLECGGADTPSNMQWQTVAEAKAKDKTEGSCRR
jgi:hypothetical protein